MKIPFYKTAFTVLIIFILQGCGGSKLPVIMPDIKSENVKYDSGDPAIWINPENPEKSIIFGTDKDTDGGIFAFGLDGKIIPEKSISGIERPNNVDLRYDFPISENEKTDILVFTERERKMLRIYAIPSMKALDNGGFPVFEGEEEGFQYPMGISLYHSPENGNYYAIVGRKNGPLENYLFQYEIKADGTGNVSLELARKFGKFSGNKEIEAIAVDDEMGFVYYSDEGECIRKYHAEPEKGNSEISCFGNEYFKDDIEGIAIATYPNEKGYLIVSDQQRHQFNIFSRDTNEFIKALNLGTTETDGCEVVTQPLNSVFRNGLFVAMSDEGNFYLYDLAKLGLAE